MNFAHTISFIIIGLLLLPLFSKGQSKFDNTIIINEFIPLEKLKASFFDRGFIVQGNDTMYIQTSEVLQSKKDAVYIKLNIKRTDSNLVIKGQMKINYSIEIWGVSSPPQFEPIEYWRDKKSLPRLAFDFVQKFALSLSSNLSYARY
jgi:hypothetical protein